MGRLDRAGLHVVQRLHAGLLLLVLSSGPAFAADDLWARLIESQQMHSVEHPLVDQWESHWRQRAGELRVMFENRGYWLYPILDQVEQRKLPGELALLPIIESQLDPRALSPRQARGIWQLLPRTAHMLGLKNDAWSDDRLHPLLATQAALNYLNYLHERFESWPLAITAYNAGEGRVSRALTHARKANRPLRVDALVLPEESRHYLPKLLGLARVLADPADLRLPWVDPASVPVRFDAGGPRDLWDIHRRSGVDIDTLYRYNPHLALWALPPRAPWTILLPAAHWPQAQTALLQDAPPERTRWRHITVRAGDSLGTLAQRHHTTVSLLRAVNGLTSTQVFVGQTLHVPTGRTELPAELITAVARERRLTLPPSSAGTRNGAEQWHQVTVGDTLWQLARRYRVSVDDLRRWNRLRDDDRLHSGQRLRIAAPPGRTAIVHPLRPRESLAAVADRYGVSVAELQRWNRLGSRDLGRHADVLIFAPH